MKIIIAEINGIDIKCALHKLNFEKRKLTLYYKLVSVKVISKFPWQTQNEQTKKNTHTTPRHKTPLL